MTSYTTTQQLVLLPASTAHYVQHLNRDIQCRPVIIGAWVVTTQAARRAKDNNK